MLLLLLLLLLLQSWKSRRRANGKTKSLTFSKDQDRLSTCKRGQVVCKEEEEEEVEEEEVEEGKEEDDEEFDFLQRSGLVIEL